MISQFTAMRILDLIPSGERWVRTYQAFEGDYRIVTIEHSTGREKRYTVIMYDGFIEINEI